MDRRTMLRTVCVGGAASVALGAPARGEITCGPPMHHGAMAMVRQCTAGVRVETRTTQRCDQWCWAACIEAAFALKGYRVAQERIVQKLYGVSWVCAPAVGPAIIAAIEGPWEDEAGARFIGRSLLLTDTQFGVFNPHALRQAIGLLRDDVPLITGALGHATLMTAISWIEDGRGFLQPTEIILRDPWPGNPNRRQMSPQEFYGTTFLAAVTAEPWG